MNDMEMYLAMENARRGLCARFGRGLDDAAAEVDAAYWELIVGGERDPARLFWQAKERLGAVRRASRRYRQYQEWTASPSWFESAEDVVDRVGAAQIIAALSPPERVRVAWERRVNGDPIGDPDRKAMRRWIRCEEVRHAAAA
jgi:hypothetical protein